MVIKDELSKVIDIFKNNNIDNYIFEAHLIFRHFLKMSPMDLVLEGNSELEKKHYDEISEAVKRRCENEPLQYILNSQEFMGLDFYVDKNVLVPRADTETLVEHILEHFTGKAFTGFNVGCGSGCIEISLAYFNHGAHMRGIDISPKAVEIATKNAEKNGVLQRCCFENYDIFSYEAFGKYDLIVSNPPYIETDEINKLEDNVRLYEPHLALDGGADGMKFYRKICDIAPKLLKKSGMLAFEVGHTQARAVGKMMEKNFENIEFVTDLCGVERVVSGLLS